MKYAKRSVIILILAWALLLGVMYDRSPSADEFRNKANIQAMYDKLGKATGQPFPMLIIEEDNLTMNAYSNGTSIHIFQGMLNYMENEDELALVLSHELSHHILHHSESMRPTLSELENVTWDLQQEENADKLGGFIMLQAGYDICNGREIWTRLKETHGDVVSNFGHPTAIFRYVNLKMPWCENNGI